jgi:uncharacterized protein YndB with AHSA1/START domain/predicted enzyme related to lactoylglutathione lyase
MEKRSGTTKTKGRELTITRFFDAPKELVWKAWVDPELLKHWWGPKTFTAPVVKIDFRVGGKYLNCMRGPDGKDYWSTGTYKEIVPMEKIVVIDSFADEKGNIVRPTHYGMSADFPTEATIIMTFETVQDNRTKFTLYYPSFTSGPEYDGALDGWKQSFDKLDEYLSSYQATSIVATHGKPEVVITRIHDGPRDMVYKMMTDPKLIPHWWGPAIYTTTVEKMDVRAGGEWRFVQRAADGREFAFHGVYRDVKPPELLVYTFNFDPMPGHEQVETITFEEMGGKTKTIDRVTFNNIEDRDGMLSTGMESGTRESQDRFAALLKNMIQSQTMRRVVHFEIPADNMDRAKKFYHNIFGWDLNDLSGPGPAYTLAQTTPGDANNMPVEAGTINGAIMERTKEVKCPVLVISVPSIESCVKEIIAAGGKVVEEKRKVMEMGYYMRVTDSEGNIIGIWENIGQM